MRCVNLCIDLCSELSRNLSAKVRALYTCTIAAAQGLRCKQCISPQRPPPSGAEQHCPSASRKKASVSRMNEYALAAVANVQWKMRNAV